MIAVVGEPVNIRRPQQSDVVLVAQHPDTDAGQLGNISDLQHSGTSMHFLSSYSEYTLTQWQSQPLKYEFLNKYPPCKPGGY